MRKFLLPLAVALVVFFGTTALAKEERAADPQATWDLTELFPTVEAWNAAREEVMADFDEIDSRRAPSETAPNHCIRHTDWSPTP